MIFAIYFVIINGHTCKLFKIMLNDVQTNDKGGECGSKTCILILYKLKGYKSKFLKTLQLYYLTIADSICLTIMPAHYLCVQMQFILPVAINASMFFV